MFPLTHSILSRQRADGLHIGAQLYISLRGQVVMTEAQGEDGGGRPMTPQTIMLWLSSGKPLLAVLAAMLWEQDQLDLDDRVARFIPEFAAGGKQDITIRHILTHTGGGNENS